MHRRTLPLSRRSRCDKNARTYRARGSVSRRRAHACGQPPIDSRACCLGLTRQEAPTLSRLPELCRRQVAVAAQAFEIAFVKNHGIRRDELLALQAVHHEYRRGAIVELGELRQDAVQPLDGTAIVVLVMADD